MASIKRTIKLLNFTVYSERLLSVLQRRYKLPVTAVLTFVFQVLDSFLAIADNPLKGIQTI